jgi:hypothetical protein
MDKKILVEKDINEGKRLIAVLDKADFQIKGAFWFYLPDSDEWRLYIGTPIEAKLGPIKAYGIIQNELAKLSPPIELSLKDISVISPDDELIGLLRIAVRTGPGISGIRFTRNVINNKFIEDAYIYRIL